MAGPNLGAITELLGETAAQARDIRRLQERCDSVEGLGENALETQARLTLVVRGVLAEEQVKTTGPGSTLVSPKATSLMKYQEYVPQPPDPRG